VGDAGRLAKVRTQMGDAGQLARKGEQPGRGAGFASAGLRSEGGSNNPDNLVVLCGAHHRALHRGRLRIAGKVSTGLRIDHADGTAYGNLASPSLADASARASPGSETSVSLKALRGRPRARALERSRECHGGVSASPKLSPQRAWCLPGSARTPNSLPSRRCSPLLSRLPLFTVCAKSTSWED
jgi:hypothetical protein